MNDTLVGTLVGTHSTLIGFKKFLQFLQKENEGKAWFKQTKKILAGGEFREFRE